MTIEYELTKDDVMAFNLYHQSHSPTARRHYYRAWLGPAFIWLVLCTGIWYLADRARGTPLRTFLDLWPLFSGVPLYLLYFPWAYRRKLRKMVDGMASEGRNRRLLCRHAVTLSPESITDAVELGQTSTVWRGVERVVRADDHLFIYINALAAIIVPRRAFAGASEFEAFAKAASGYHQQAVAQ